MFAQNTGIGSGSQVAHVGIQGGWDESESLFSLLSCSFRADSKSGCLLKSTVPVRSLKPKQLLRPRKRRRNTSLASFRRSSMPLEERKKLASISSSEPSRTTTCEINLKLTLSFFSKDPRCPRRVHLRPSPSFLSLRLLPSSSRFLSSSS